MDIDHNIKKEVIIDGNDFSNLSEFYDEVEKKLTKNLGWKIGRNLDAYNDVLRGGFGVYEYGEQIRLVWKNSIKSRKDLGYPETIRFKEEVLLSCHPSNKLDVRSEIQSLKENRGETLFEIITSITRSHAHIEFLTE